MAKPLAWWVPVRYIGHSFVDRHGEHVHVAVRGPSLMEWKFWMLYPGDTIAGPLYHMIVEFQFANVSVVNGPKSRTRRFAKARCLVFEF